MITPIPTEYKGYWFRSRLEARWAVFFDLCGVQWEYEPEGFTLENGQRYLPDFLLHDVKYIKAGGKTIPDLWVEVKGKMSKKDAAKIESFYGWHVDVKNECFCIDHPIYVIVGFPDGDTIEDIDDFCRDKPKIGDVIPYDFATIDGDWFTAYPGLDSNADFALFGDDSSYLCARDAATTLKAFRMVRHVRFDHDQTPTFQEVKKARYYLKSLRKTKEEEE